MVCRHRQGDHLQRQFSNPINKSKKEGEKLKETPQYFVFISQRSGRTSRLTSLESRSRSRNRSS